jgi:hypothetical protein
VIRRCLWLIILIAMGSEVSLAQYVTLTGKLQGANGANAANYTISFQPSQMGFVAGTGVVLPTVSECGTSIDGTVVGLPNPTNPLIAAVAYSGTLPPATYFFEYAWYDSAGHVTLASTEQQQQLTSTGQIQLSPPASGVPASAVGMNVYIGASSGSETLQGTTTGGATFVQSTPLASGAALPSSNTTICSLIANDAIWPIGTGYNVTLVDPSGNTQPNYPMMWQLLGPNSTINLSNGLPYYNGLVTFPTPILAVPLNHATQSISGPLDMDGYNISNVGTLTANTIQVNNFSAQNLISSETPLIDVRSCGAVSGAADVTADFQQCIDNAFAIGGVVYVPPGVWNVNGPIQSSCDAILCIPVAPDTGPPSQLKIIGSTHVRQDANGLAAGTLGTLIVTTTTGVDANSAIIGVPKVSTNAASFNNLDLYISDIDFRTYTNPDIGCVNAQWSAGFAMVYFRCEVGQSYVGSVKVEPTNVINAISLPTIDNDTLALLKFGEISGYNTSITASEHANIEQVTLAYCIVGVNFTGGYHQATVIHLQSQECGTPVEFTGSSIPFDMTIDLEIDYNNVVCPVSNSWCYSGIDIADPNSYGRGLVKYTKVIAASGSTTLPIVWTGGENLNFFDQYNNVFAIRNSKFRSEFTVGGLPTPNSDKIYPTISAEYFDLDGLLSGYDPTGAGTADPNRAIALQVYSGGSGNTLGTTPWKLLIQPAGGGVYFPTLSPGCLDVGTGGLLASTGSGCNSAQNIIITSGICTASGGSYNTCTDSAPSVWPTTFADTNYSVTCQGINPSNGTGPSGSISGSIYNVAKTATGITLSLQTMTSSGFSYGEVDCLAKHN